MSGDPIEPEARRGARAVMRAASILCAAGLLVGGPASPARAADAAGGAKDPAAEERARLVDQVLYRQKGIAEAKATEILGMPADRTTRGDATLLTWGAADAACRMTGEFKAGVLASVTFDGKAGWDRKACKAAAKPLIDAAPAPGSPSAAARAASLVTLDNAGVVAMVKEGRPTQAIIALVHTSPCKFDVSNEATMALRRDGVAEAIINAMTERDCR